MKTFWTIWVICAALFVGSLYTTGVRADESVPLPEEYQKQVDAATLKLKAALEAFSVKLESMQVSKADGDALMASIRDMVEATRDMNAVSAMWTGAITMGKYYSEHPGECPGASEGANTNEVWKRM